MYVRPKYLQKDIKCYYCDKNKADRQYEYQQDLYCVTKHMKAWLGYRYYELQVYVPRCEECYKLHNSKGKRIPIYVAWALFTVIAGYVFFGVFDMWESFIQTVTGLGMTVMCGLIGGGLVALITSSSAPKEGIKAESDVSGYFPISKLEGAGMLNYKPDPSKSPTPAKPEAVEKAFNEIVEQGDCFVVK